jgi:putative ABC transport system permease protein
VSALLRKSVADIVRRRTRSLFVVLAMTLAVAGLVAVNVADTGLSAAYAFTVGGNATQPDVTVALDRARPQLLSAITDLPNVAAVQPSTTFGTQWHVDQAPGHVSFTIVAYPDPRTVALSPFQLVDGRYPGDGEVVLEYGDTALQPIRLGDQVTVDTAGGSASLRVVGIARTSGLNPAVSGKAVGYMSVQALSALPAYTYQPGQEPRQPLRVEQVGIKLRNPAAYQETADAVGALARADGVTVLAVFPPGNDAPLRQLRGVFTLVRVLVGVALLLAAMLLVNTVTTLVTEQAGVIGTMKALGAGRTRIVRGYLTTVGLYGLAAAPAGTAVGVLAGRLLTQRLAASIPLATGPLPAPVTAVVLGIAVAFGVPFVAAFVPLWLGTRVSVRDALAAWGVMGMGGTGAGWLARLVGGRLVGVPQTVWLSLRGLWRRPWRAGLSVATVATAAVCFLVVQTMAVSVSASIAAVWQNLDGDVEVYVGGDTSRAQIERVLDSVPNVEVAERVAWLGAGTPWGKIALWGVEPNSRLYHHELTSGRWFTPADTGVVLLGDQFAERSGLHVGSTLPVTGPGGAQRGTWTVIGTLREAVDDVTQVGAAVAPVNQVYELLGAPAAGIADYANRVLVRAKNRSAAGVDRLTRDIDQAGRMAAAGGRDGPVSEVFTFHDEVLRHQRHFTPLYALLLAVATIVAAVGVLGLADALGSSVVERQKDIGLLRALGASGRRVATVFWLEGLALSLLAWLLAALAGVPLAYLFVRLFQRRVMPVTFHVAPWAFASTLAVALMVPTLASVAPALRVASMRAVNLLRYQ